MMGYLHTDHLLGAVLLIAPVILQNCSVGTLLWVAMCSAIAYRYGDFIYRSYLTLRRDLT